MNLRLIWLRYRKVYINGENLRYVLFTQIFSIGAVDLEGTCMAGIE